MPKKKSTEIARTVKEPPPPAKRAIAKAGAASKTGGSARRNNAAIVDLAQFPSGFENKAGRYELIRVDGDQAYYSFTNHNEKTVDATMPIITWRKMQSRADAGLKESA